MKKVVKAIVKVVVFVMIFTFIFNSVTEVLVAQGKMDFQGIHGFYDEREDSLDAVYIGSSNCFAYWNPLIAWEEYGITVRSFACNTQPFYAVEYLIKEARKTQENAVFVVNINTLNDDTVNFQQMHKLLDSMPNSLNKLALTKRLSDIGDYSFEDRLEFYFPIIRYHSRWSEFTLEDVKGIEPNGFKGAVIYRPYLTYVENVKDDYISTDKRTELTDEILVAVDSLLDYCDEENIEVLFVTVPQVRERYYDIEKYNTLNDIIEERGYKTLSLINNPEVINLDFETDFYNNHHTNIHGSVKFTHYVSEYLIDNYNFTDKRGNPEYEDWDRGLENYKLKVNPHFLDFEWTDKRDYSLKNPQPICDYRGKSIQVDWNEVEGADGYSIYRKVGGLSEWECIKNVDSTSFTDYEVEVGKVNYYTVVPYSLKNNQKYFGFFEYKGIRVEIN